MYTIRVYSNCYTCKLYTDGLYVIAIDILPPPPLSSLPPLPPSPPLSPLPLSSLSPPLPSPFSPPVVTPVLKRVRLQRRYLITSNATTVSYTSSSVLNTTPVCAAPPVTITLIHSTLISAYPSLCLGEGHAPFTLPWRGGTRTPPV